MGLDMYLTAEKYISQYGTPEEEAESERLNEALPQAKGMSLCGVQYRAAYWRKANAIHKWFIKNVQGGVDECSPYGVEREQLKELRELCQRVLEDHSLASQLLPTESGFFFGSTEYDEWYFEGLKDTIEQLDKCLELDNSFSFEYQSSW
jgi:hypothetical protein